MNDEELNQERLAMLGAAFKAGYMFGHGSEIQPDTKSEKTIIHNVPQMPIMIDGVQAEPEAIKQYDGQPLHYILDEQALAKEMLPIFTTRRKAKEYFNQMVVESSQKSEEKKSVSHQFAGVPTYMGDVALYEHVNFRGDEWIFSPYDDGIIRDFRYVKCWFGGRRWWCTNINDKVSSVDANIWDYYDEYYITVVLHEHIQLQGSTFRVGQGYIIDSLVPYGWNDRASSMSYLYGPKDARRRI